MGNLVNKRDVYASEQSGTLGLGVPQELPLIKTTPSIVTRMKEVHSITTAYISYNITFKAIPGQSVEDSYVQFGPVS